MLMITYNLWYEGCGGIGYYQNWHVTWVDTIWAFLSLVLFFPSFAVIEKAKTFKIDEKKRVWRYIVLNSILAIFSPIVPTYIGIENSVGIGSLPVFFGLTVGMLVGFSSYVSINIKHWKESSKIEAHAYLESLKLTHDWIWRLINIVTWIVTILVVSVYYILYTQLIDAMMKEINVPLTSTGILAVAFALPAIYLLFGLWFGMLGPLIGYALSIPKSVASIKGLEKS